MNYLLAGFVATTLVFSGCSSDSGSDGGIDREDVSSSSSSEQSSSSSKKVSSSSAKKEMPDGVRAATLDDLSRNMLIDIDGHEIHMAAGSKQGLFSFWLLRGDGKGQADTGEVVVKSDFADGVIKLTEDNATASVITTLEKDFFLYKMAKKMTIEFTVDSAGTLMYSVDKAKAKDVKSEQVPATQAKIGKYDDMVGKKLTCKSGDTTDVYKFFEGRYVMESTAGKKNILMVGGFADIHRGTLLLMPEYFSDGVMALYKYSVSSEFDLDSLGCTSEEFKFKAIKAKDLADNWYSYDKELKLDWNFMLNEDGTYKLEAFSNTNEQGKGGHWDIYGNVLLLRGESCVDPSSCEVLVMGTVEDFEKGKGFTYKHSSGEVPPMPTEWVIQKYED
ncbi:hypothetical protein [uncultured Fibrobacter sp.]|uniref:hypothetical protein n=1 Tax=uncultured Fibrobacter sp. TaxID=261512 RepID=UPI00260A5783|nr:hypothetical protein [uncultured Fibrobacter sp.]